jgi:ribonuclease HII
VAQARTWGTKPFENDAAVGWLADLKSTGVDSIANALKQVNDEKSGQVPAEVCSTAIAAASIVAAARDGQTELLDQDALAWLQSSGFKPDGKLTKQAKTAVQTCRGASRSELYMVWMAIPNATAWIDTVKTLMKRLDD